MTPREKELIEKGKRYEARERAELIDNAYRAGLFREKWPDDSVSNEEISNMYKKRLKELGHQH